MYGSLNFTKFDGNFPRYEDQKEEHREYGANLTLPFLGQQCVIVVDYDTPWQTTKVGRLVTLHKEFKWQVHGEFIDPKFGDLWAVVDNIQIKFGYDWNDLKRAMYYRTVGVPKVVNGEMHHFGMEFTSIVHQTCREGIKQTNEIADARVALFIETLKKCHKDGRM